MAKITKLKDDRFFGNHPNGIDEGFEVSAEIIPLIPVVGESYRFGRLLTSEVTIILEITNNHYLFKTRNSTYKIEL
jgi:hypothetical protein